jgi:hypothetical protein
VSAAPEPPTSLYLNVVLRLNEDYYELKRHLDAMDLRKFYLRTFEISLSAALPEPLWDMKAYKDHLEKWPMPDDNYSMLDYETFRSTMAFYEMVMRDYNLIGLSKKTDKPIMGLGQYRRTTDV